MNYEAELYLCTETKKRKKATAVLLFEGCDDTTQLSGSSLVGGNTFLDTGS